MLNLKHLKEKKWIDIDRKILVVDVGQQLKCTLELIEDGVFEIMQTISEPFRNVLENFVSKALSNGTLNTNKAQLTK